MDYSLRLVLVRLDCSCGGVWYGSRSPNVQFDINLTTSVTTGRGSTLVCSQCHCVVTVALLELIVIYQYGEQKENYQQRSCIVHRIYSSVMCFRLLSISKNIFIFCVFCHTMNVILLILQLTQRSMMEVFFFRTL